jgi:Nitrile hydratase beta subunit
MPILKAGMVETLVKTGASCRVDAKVAPRFRCGERVVARNINPLHHTRPPRYVRGKRGTVERERGVFVFPDTNAHARGHKPQHVYSVRFTGRELWGPQASERDVLYIDLWDDYMDPV